VSSTQVSETAVAGGGGGGTAAAFRRAQHKTLSSTQNLLIFGALSPPRANLKLCDRRPREQKIWGFYAYPKKYPKASIKRHITHTKAKIQQNHPLNKCAFSACVPAKYQFSVYERLRRWQKEFVTVRLKF